LTITFPPPNKYKLCELLKPSHFKILIIVIILTVLGGFIIPRLSVRLNPSNTLPSITVQYFWPDASPYHIEREVSTILEGGFSTIRGLKQLNSKSSKGFGTITLEFDSNINMDVVRFETATIIRHLVEELPEDVSYPVISINRPDSDEVSAFLSYSINAQVSPYEIQKVVKTQIDPIIGAIPLVDKTEIYGAMPLEYVFDYDYDQLQSLGITKQDLIATLKRVFTKQSLGEVNYNTNFITISVQPSPEFDWHIPIKKTGDRIVYLDEITRVGKQEQEAQAYYRINGNNAITLAIYAANSANTIDLSNDIQKKLDELQSDLPAGFSVIKGYDSTEYLKIELSKIYERTLYTVIILLCFILLVTRSFRYLIVTVMSLLANIGIAFLLYYLFHIEIQLYSMAGITISLGLIIDNSIVMIDHIRNQGNTKIFIPILASTLTTICALSIINFLDEEIKVNLIDFALVIIVNLSVSLFLALFFIPALLYKIPLPKHREPNWSTKAKEQFYYTYEAILTRIIPYKGWMIVFLIFIFGLPLFMLPKTLKNTDAWYGKAYNSVLGDEWYLENMRPYVDRYSGGALRLFSNYVGENSYYRVNKETKLYVTLSMEKGASIHQMNEVLIDFENYLLQFDEIKQFITEIKNEGLGKLEIVFKDDLSVSSFPNFLKSKLIIKSSDYGGIDWNIFGIGNAFSSSTGSDDPANFTVIAKGYDYDELGVWIDSLRTALRRHPRIQKVVVKENSFFQKKASFEYKFVLDKERASLLKIPPSKVFDELRNNSLSKYPDMYLHLNGDYIPVRLQSKQSEAFSLWDLKNAPLDSLTKPIFLKDMVTLTQEREEENIYKENQEFIKRIEFLYNGGSKSGATFLDKTLEDLEAKIPFGFSFEGTHGVKLFELKQKQNYLLVFVLIIGFIFFICAILFESMKQPFIVLNVIPISYIGVFLTFYLFGFNFDQGGLASFVLLSGITVNAAIFILYGFNKLRMEFPETSNITLYVQAFKQKIFPILLTVFSTILGFVPFVKDGQNEIFWFALGVGTIGGLLFSLIAILVYLPLFSLKKS